MDRVKKMLEERAKRADWTRRILKQFLYALHTSEGFGEMRLLRVLLEWSEVYKKVNDPRNNMNDEMLMIDSVLEKVLPEIGMASVGREKLLDRKGKEIK